MQSVSYELKLKQMRKKLKKLGASNIQNNYKTGLNETLPIYMPLSEIKARIQLKSLNNQNAIKN